MVDKADKTINLTEANKAWLLSLKTHERETPNDIITRLKEKIERKDGVIVA